MIDTIENVVYSGWMSFEAQKLNHNKRELICRLKAF